MSTVIIGGGASALACAIRLKQICPDRDVIILERLGLLGKKLLATGNGRCNLTNKGSEYCDVVLDFFSSIGLKTRADEEGRIYPYSNQATTVLQILLDACDSLGVKCVTDCNVTGIKRDLSVITDKGTFKADSVVVATGGKAQSALGSNGSGYELLRALGHKITPLSPALVQLTSSSKYPRILKGNRIKCNMKILLDDEVAGEEYGEVLFTDYGLSGIVSMDLSQIVAENFSSKAPKKCHAVLDLIDDMTQEEIVDYLKKFATLKGILGEKLALAIDKQAHSNIIKTAQLAKNWKLILTGTKGYDFAQITSGGADLNDFDDLESRRVKGVYACGEVLDKQFQCGGFNLSFAWYSGIRVAEKIAGK